MESGSAEFTSSWQPDLEDFKPPPQDNFGGHLLPALFQDCDVNAQRNERATPQPGLSYLLCPPVVKFSKQSWGRGPIAHNSKEMTMPFYSSMLLSNQPPPICFSPPLWSFPHIAHLGWQVVAQRGIPPSSCLFLSLPPAPDSPPGHTQIALGVLPRLATKFSYPALPLVPPFHPGGLLNYLFQVSVVFPLLCSESGLRY